jgi:hypothetical protein
MNLTEYTSYVSEGCQRDDVETSGCEEHWFLCPDDDDPQ